MNTKSLHKIILQAGLPVLLTILLFAVTVIFVEIPTIRKNMIESKKLMLKELTNTTIELVSYYYQKEVSGELSKEKAQEESIARIRELRYGSESKDYFWINDMHPNMIMHPYFRQLEGHDISKFTDPKGKLLFIEMIKTVKNNGDGYVNYMWQWKDDSTRVVSKLSYVKGFKPWAWVIGTGVYLEDVHAEITAVTKKLYFTFLGIFIPLLLISLYIIINRLNIENQNRLTKLSISRSKNRFRTIMQSIGEAIIATDVNGSITEMNDIAETLTGWRIAEARNKLLCDVFNIEDSLTRKKINNPVKEVIATSNIIQLNRGTSLIAKNGNKYHIAKSAAPIKNNKGEITGVVLSFRDISEERKTQAILKESEVRYRSLFESANDSIFITKAEKIIDCNPKTLEIFGCKKDEIIGQTPIDFSPLMQPNGKRSDKEAMSKINAAMKGNPQVFEWQHKKLNGTLFYAHISLNLIDLPSGKFIMAIIRDIDNRKQIEQEIIAANEELMATTDALKESNEELTIALKKAQKSKELEILNEKLQRNEQILLLAHKSLKQKQEQLKETNEELQASEEEIKQTNKELTSTNELLHKQKQELEYTLEQLKETQSQLIQSEKMASVGILSAGIAHEINNPLNFIQGGVLGIEKYFTKSLGNHLENILPLINGIKTGVKRAADIVNSLNHFNKKSDKKNEECDIHSIIDNCLVMLNNKLKHKVKVEKHYTRSDFAIIGNEGKLHQVILNILLNAEQSIAENGSILITSNIENNKLKLQIKDTGCGISKENISKITDPFFTTKDPGKGTGLGLSIVYKIIKDHNGNLEYKSILGKGTTVTIILPVKI